jgi:hypothetical protein
MRRAIPQVAARARCGTARETTATGKFYQPPEFATGACGSRDHRKGFSTAILKYSCRALKSSDQIRLQPPRSAAATIMPS